MRSAVLLAAVCALLAAPAHADVVTRIDQETNGADITLRIEFAAPMRYLSHDPANRGDTLQIRLQALPSSVTEGVDVSETQVYARTPSRALPLIEVRYEGSTGTGPLLTLRFDRPVSYEVRGAKDLRSILVVFRGAARATQAVTSRPSTPSHPGRSRGRSAGRGYLRKGDYAVNLLSSRGPVSVSSIKLPIPLDGLHLYVADFQRGAVVWHRVRVGWFATRPEAEFFAARVRKAFPQAWVDRVTESERRAATATAPVPEEPVQPVRPQEGRRVITPTELPPSSPGKPSSTSEQRAADLLSQARREVTARRYTRAIQLCSKVLQLDAPAFHPEARELLGVARERNGQLAHAKAEYEEYLRRYPTAEGAERVRQRLAALITATLPGRKPLRPRKVAGSGAQWQRYGSFSQFYRRDQSFTGPSGATVTQSALDTTLDVTGRRRGERVDMRTQLTGRYVADFLDFGESDLRVSELYADANDARTHLSGRFGRQSRSTGGVLGRFDGALMSYRPFGKLMLTGVSGFPVESSTGEGVNTDKVLYGLSMDVGTLADKWDANAFIVDQTVDGVTDRRAVGGELRYFDPQRSFFGLVDYDISYRTLNTLLLLGTVIFPDATTVNLTLDYRKSPLLETSNALQGQSVDSIDELLDTMTESQVRQLARDRTATSRAFTIGGSKPLTAKLQLSGDFTISNTSDTPASGGVPATPPTGNEFRYSVQLTGSSLVKAGDITTIGVQYNDTQSSRSAALTLNTRYPVNSAWRINPRLRFDVRDGIGGTADQITVRPSARIEYRWRRRLRLELEAGGEFLSESSAGTSGDTYGYFLNLGYRADF